MATKTKTTKTPAKRVTKPPVAQDKLAAAGIDAVCAALADGDSLTRIARGYEVSPGSLLTWVEADPDRSARVRAMRGSMAKFWDEKAESDIAGATDDFELKKAKELAHHYRWRSSKIAVKDYGDRVATELTGADGGAVKFEGVTDKDLDARISALSKKLAEVK